MKHTCRNEEVQIVGRVIVVLENMKTGKKRIIRGVNIVTDKGDKYYAQAICSEAPDDDFDGANSGIRLGSNNTAPTKLDNDVTTFLSGTEIGLEATYPKTNDPDPENAGKGVDVVSWSFYYTTGEGNADNIIEGAIVDDRVTPTGALTHFLFAEAFNKTSSDRMRIFVNSIFNGV